MAVSTRLRGKQGLIFTLKIGAASAISYADDVKSWELSPEDADDSDVTFTEAAAGLSKVWTLKVTAITGYDTGSLWKSLWNNPGVTYTVVLGPWGNTTASATQPQLNFTATGTGKPPISNEASTGPNGAEFDYEFAVVGDPTLVTS